MEALVSAVEGLRDAVEGARLPLDVTTRAPAEAARKQLLQQLDDYVLPRLRAIDAPLLAVVGGSTGAGKSTLVNSVVGAEVSRSGVLRPTTTSPVLVHHPDDRHWFADARILPGLARVTGQDTGESQAGTVRLVESTTLPAGMALLDAPDIDSVVSANRGLADPAAVGGRPLALRHHRGPVRRCRAVGPAAHGRRPRHLGRDRARPHPAGCRGRDPPPPRLDAARAGAADRTDLHRPRDGARRRGPTARGCRGAAALLAPGAGRRLPGPRHRGPPDPARRGRLAVRAHRGARRRQPRPARRGRRRCARPSTSRTPRRTAGSTRA